MQALFNAFTAITEVLNLATDLIILLVGVQTIRAMLDAIDRIVKVWLWLSGLTQLLFCLICSVIGDYLPVVAKYAGKLSGRIYRFGIQSRKFWDIYCHPVVVWADYESRKFVKMQFGDHFLSDWASPYCLVVREAFPGILEGSEGTFETLTRRQLIDLAKSIGLSGYSRMNTETLREAIATV